MTWWVESSWEVIWTRSARAYLHQFGWRPLCYALMICTSVPSVFATKSCFARDVESWIDSGRLFSLHFRFHLLWTYLPFRVSMLHSLVSRKAEVWQIIRAQQRGRRPSWCNLYHAVKAVCLVAVGTSFAYRGKLLTWTGIVTETIHIIQKIADKGCIQV